MAHSYDTMMNPQIEELLDRTESKFILVTLAALRSREITDYMGQLGRGIGAIVPRQVVSASATKPLSIALEEIAAGKIEPVPVDADDETDEASDGVIAASAGPDLVDASDMGHKRARQRVDAPSGEGA